MSQFWNFHSLYFVSFPISANKVPPRLFTQSGNLHLQYDLQGSVWTACSQILSPAWFLLLSWSLWPPHLSSCNSLCTNWSASSLDNCVACFLISVKYLFIQVSPSQWGILWSLLWNTPVPNLNLSSFSHFILPSIYCTNTVYFIYLSHLLPPPAPMQGPLGKGFVSLLFTATPKTVAGTK